MTIDIALICIPKHGVNVPPLALAYLSGAVRAAGYKVAVKDLNVELYELTLHSAWRQIWLETNTTLYKDPGWSIFVENFYGDVLDKWAEHVVSINSEWLGISCLSYRSIPTLRLLVPKIRKLRPELKIVIGGAPISYYGKDLILEGLADYAVMSEGEIALVELLKGNSSYPGIIARNKLESPPTQIANLDTLAPPNYEGLDFKLYTPGDPGGLIALEDGYNRFGRQAGVMASRGCVRRCTFCDVENFWPKFRWRSASSIFEEMVRLWNENNVSEIYFHDSLINGSISELQQLLKLIIRERHRYPFILRGLAIIRNQPEAIYSQFEDAGFVQLQIGIESFSERLRADMRKQFTNELLAQNLENYAKTKIKIVLLLMAGYPTETEQDQLENLLWIERNQHFKERPIWRLDWGGTALILPGAPLMKEGEHRFSLDENDDWIYENDSEINSMSLRIQRLKDSESRARQLGWRVGSSYAGGEMVVGDMEKGIFKERPQDSYGGWERDKARATTGYKDA